VPREENKVVESLISVIRWERKGGENPLPSPSFDASNPATEERKKKEKKDSGR